VGRAAIAGAGGATAGLAGLTGAVSARDAGVFDGVFPVETPDGLRDWGDKLSTAPYVQDQEGLVGSLPLVLGDPLRAAGSGLAYLPKQVAVGATQLVAGRPAAERLSEYLNPEDRDPDQEGVPGKLEEYSYENVGLEDPDAIYSTMRETMEDRGITRVPRGGAPTVIERLKDPQTDTRLPPMQPPNMPETFEEWMKSSGANEQSLTMSGFDKGLAQAQIAAALLGARKGRLGEALGEGITAATPVVMAGREGEWDQRQQGITNRLAYQGLADKKPYYDSLSAFNSARAEGVGVKAGMEARQQALAEAQDDITLGMSIRVFAENMARYGTPEVHLGSRELPEWASMSETQKEEKIKLIMEQMENRKLAEWETGRRLRSVIRGSNSGGLVGSSGGTVAEKMNFR